MQVRPLTEADADAYRRLRIVSIEESPDYACPGIVRELAMDMRGHRVLMVHAGEGGQVWGAFDAGRLVGAVAVSRDLPPNTAQAEAWGLYVITEHRRNGVGAMLLLSLLRWCRQQQPGIERILLRVSRRNERAIRWLAHVGFKPLDQDPEAAPQLLTMCWRLTPATTGPAARDEVLSRASA